jgi:hypothetical protein
MVFLCLKITIRSHTENINRKAFEKLETVINHDIKKQGYIAKNEKKESIS